MAVVDTFLNQTSEDQITEKSGTRNFFKKLFATATSGQFWALYRSDRKLPSFLNSLGMYFLVGFTAMILATKSRRLFANEKNKEAVRYR